MPSRDQQRYRLTYSYYRVQPRMEVQYIVDDSLDWKNSVRVASTASVSLTGSTPLSIDSVTLASGNRVLLKDQGTGSQNGIYVYSVDESGSNYTLTRSYDATTGTLSCGASTYVEDGSTNAATIYILSTLEPITVDSTSLTWTQFSGGGGGLGGSGTTNYVSKFTASSTIGNSNIYDDGTNVGIGTNSFSGRFYISGSSTASQPTLVVRGGKSSPTGNAGLLDVQNSAGTSVLFVTGTLATIGGRVGIGTNMPTALLHVSGTYGGSSHGIKIGEPNVFGVATNVYTSLQHSFYGGDGSTLRLALDSSGNILAGGSLGFAGNTARLYVTGSSTASNQGIVYKAGVASPTGPLLDIKDYSGNSIIFVSGSGLSGSLTKLTDGTSYLIAGPNITITTGSSGAVTIEAAGGGGGGPTGSGTDGYLTRWTGTSTLGDSHIYYWTAGSGGSIYRYKGYQHQIVSPNDTVSLVLEADNTTGARVGINSSGPAYPLDVIEGVAGTSTIANFRNNDVSGGTDRGVQMYLGAGNFNPGTLQLLHEWKTDRHYTRFRTTNLSSLDPMFATSGPIEDLLVLSSDRKVLVTGSLQVQYDASSQVGTVMDVRRSNGNQLMWMSSSAGSNPVGTDVFMWVSGSRTDNNSGADKVVFGGDVRISGSLSVGTGSVFVTANDIQFGSSAMRIQKNGNDMKFFDVSNPSGYTLTELAAGGGGGGSSPEYWTSPSSGFIYATGSVGIGSNTNDSSYRLNVYQTTNFDDLRVKFEQAGADYSSKLYLVGGNSFLTYGDPYGAPTNEISSLYRDGLGDLQSMWRIWGGLKTNNMALETGGLEAMRITETQKVGIGTTSPTEKFSVHNTGQDRVGFGISSAVSTVYLGSITSTEAYRTIEFDRSAGKLHFKYGTVGSALSTVATFNASGQVGIGNTAPTTKLFVESSSGVQIEATDGTVSQRVGYCLTNIAYSGTSTGHPYALLTTDVERMRIDTTGNVGIGTSSYTGRLYISGSGTGTTTTLVARHGVANGSALPVLNVQNSAGDSLLYVSGSGFVGIGTSTASSITNLLKSLGGNVLSLSGPFAASLLFEVNGNLSGSITTSNSGMTVVPGTNRTLGLGSDNGVKLSIDTEGDINLQTSDRYFDASISSGQGIRLRSSPGNSDAQVLDAYYEKDLVVTLESTNSNLDCSLYTSSQTLKFTRIGRLVTISGYLQVETVNSTGTGRLYIDLGTTSGERPSSSSAVSLYINQPDPAVDWDNPVIGYADSGTSRIYIDRYELGQAVSNGLTLSQFVVPDQEFMVSVSYSTN